MDVVLILLPFVLIGAAVLFIAFSGGPTAAREIYLTRGGRWLRVVTPLLYLALGVGVPAAVIAARDEARGGTGGLRQADLSERGHRGKDLFKQNCASCHNLDAVNARGNTGPDLDEVGRMTRERVVQAIENGGTGQKRMPARIVRGEDAEDVAIYLSRVAGK